MTKALIDLDGIPRWYTTDWKWFYSYAEHQSVAFSESLSGDPNRRALFASLTGEYLGWFQDGWIYSSSGEPCMFVDPLVL